MDVFSTEFLGGVVESLQRPGSFILDRYFSRVQTFPTEEIHFDVIDKKRRIAPFVSPAAPGKVMNKVGRKVNSFSPAYTKDKRVFEPSLTMKRAVGEQIGGNQVPLQARLEAAITIEVQDQIDVLTRRFELMGVESLRTGKCVISGDLYEAQTVDFQRASSLTFATPAQPWNVPASATPITNLKTWARAAFKLGSAFPTDIFLSPADFDFFLAAPEVSARWNSLNAQRLGVDITLGAPITEGGVYMGSIDGFNIFMYTGWYTGEDDVGSDSANQILPDGRCFGVSPQVQGVRAFGAIKDLDSLQEAEYFAKSWAEDDPSARFIMLQSAPLMIPTRPNASFGAQIY